MTYLKMACEKYKWETGNRLGNDISVLRLAEILSKKKRSKKESWEIIINYCDGERPFYTKQEKRQKRKQKINKQIYLNGTTYSVENARAFYQSLQWRKIRVDIISEQGGECQMCGRSHQKHGVVIHVDHIIPLSIDWSKRLDKNNLQVLCEDCNLGKINRYSTDWRKAEFVGIKQV